MYVTITNKKETMNFKKRSINIFIAYVYICIYFQTKHEVGCAEESQEAVSCAVTKLRNKLN